ncbi:uncharacterized protein LOC133515996 [Cydia pomonella]|uniref:uncharacterized protein LOC133515996 n=1 Tax=Cydia pomonella TaxID=82600 RepID=UPI002ADE4459|nr:uncharacterized protein LOC133515996 [Cydia pomonella]
MKKKTNNVLISPKKQRQRKTVLNTMDSFTQNALRRIVHEFFSRNEIPTLTKILNAVNSDTTLENYKRSTLHKLLRHIGFKFIKRSRNSLMNDREDLQYWRRNYLKCVKEARAAGKKIFYLDETWVNEGHTKSLIWLDSTIQNARHAMINGLSSGLRNPSGKGKRLIVTHIGSEDGFVEGGLLVFESKNKGDYHQDMNAEVFEEWFTQVLDKIPDGSVIVLDNAPYHSRKIEKVPNTQSRKNEIIDWLKERNLFTINMNKKDLLDIVRAHKNRYEAFVVDEIAKQRNKTVLRLPPYHCELNPIEMIWSQVKGYVANNNKTFKLAEVKQLLREGISKVNAESWKKCIKHVIEVVETKMSIVEPLDRFIINLENDSSASEME